MSDPIRATRLSMRQAQGNGRFANAAALPNHLGATTHRGADEASGLLKRLFRSFDGSVALRLWNGATLSLGKAGKHEPNPRFTLVCHHPGVVRSMVLGRDPLCLAEAYFRGHVDVEGDFFAALSLQDHLQSIRLSFLDQLGALLAAFRLGATDNLSSGSGTGGSPLHGNSVRAHSRTENRASTSFHYDVSNEFYRLWLDEERVYSCAYFTNADESLDQAQRNKLEHICRKLRLRPGERLLDIGCGWGAMVCWAARHHGVRAHGITLSRQQLDCTQERIRAEGLQDQVTVELLDFRDLAGRAVYDKVSSIGMFEHVGLANLPAYLATVQRVLRPGGLFLPVPPGDRPESGAAHASRGEDIRCFGTVVICGRVLLLRDLVHLGVVLLCRVVERGRLPPFCSARSREPQTHPGRDPAHTTTVELNFLEKRTCANY